MKKSIFICLLALILLLAGCGELAHTCADVCNICGLCTDATCDEAVCAQKCHGHHTCANVCNTCGFCTNATCTEAVCAQKCQGHHTCANVCNICGLCTDATCDEAVCAQKCHGHHTCANVCNTCGLCTNATCTEAVCAQKCQGHHTCANVCNICGLCTDATCDEAVCAQKCHGHHTCANVCNTCGFCTNAACAEAVCAQKCQGHHTCTSGCLICGYCGDLECAEVACAPKCEGHKEEVHQFHTGDYITSAEEHIDTGNFVFDLGENVYVRGDLAELMEKIGTVMEKVSGFDFDGAGYAQNAFPDGKVHINASRENLYVGLDWYTGSPYSEVGRAFAAGTTHASIPPGDLLIRPNYTLVHELGHVLMFRQTEWAYCTLLTEGFTEYTTYLVLLHMQENDPAMLAYLGVPGNEFWNMKIDNYPELYAHPLEYWFENTFEYAVNKNYSIGFRFMTYLHDVYGDYSKWITEFEKAYCFREYGHVGQTPVEWQIEVLKATYGDDVLDNFYPWLQEHESSFSVVYEKIERDLRGAESVTWYPVFHAIASMATIDNLKYQDLYIDLQPMRQYLTEYKDFSSDDLKLVLSKAAMVYLYREDGSYTAACTNKPIDLTGIAYIKLVGEGELKYIKIDGSFCMEW